MPKETSVKALLAICLFPLLARAESLYSDTWVNWTPVGKVYDVACFSKKNGDKVLKDIRITQLNRKAFQYKEPGADSELKASQTKNCFFEQKDPHPVSRDEFFEEIVAVKCSLNQLPFKDGDFRILGTNSATTSVKRLRDGKVWILPSADCTFTTQLPKKPMVPAAFQQPSVAVNPELAFPGQDDQAQAAAPEPQPAKAGKPAQKKAPEPKPAAQDPAPQALPAQEPSPAEPVASPEPKPVVPESLSPAAPQPHEPIGGTIKALINNLN
jgi:hypothetical protein